MGEKREEEGERRCEENHLFELTRGQLWAAGEEERKDPNE